MSHQNRAKRRHSLDLTPTRRHDSSPESLPVGTDCMSYQRAEREAGEPSNRAAALMEVDPQRSVPPKRSSAARRLVFDSPRGTPVIGPGTSFEPIVAKVASSMTAVFGDISDAFDRLHNLKITVTEASEVFAKLPMEKRLEHIKSYPVEYCRELLEAEMLSNQRLADKNKLLLKRNCELEQRLEFVETNVERMQNEVIDKTERAVHDLISRFSTQEAVLLSAREKEARTVEALGEANLALGHARSALEETVKRQTAEIAQLKQEVAGLGSRIETANAQKKVVDDQLDVVKRREQELSRRLTDTEHLLQTTRDELRRTANDLDLCNQDKRQLVSESKDTAERFRQESLSHRNKLQDEWNAMRTRLEREFENEKSRLRRQLDEQKRDLDDTSRALECARAKVEELEADQDAYRARVTDELQRALMHKYRDLIQEFPNSGMGTGAGGATQTSRPLRPNTNSASRGKENDRLMPQKDKKQKLTQVLSMAVSRYDQRK